jgi:hypothetical protein
MLLTDKVKKKIPYLLGAIILLYIVKPSILFKPNGKPRIYGIGYDDEGYKKTLYNMQFAILVIVVLLYTFS